METNQVREEARMILFLSAQEAELNLSPLLMYILRDAGIITPSSFALEIGGNQKAWDSRFPCFATCEGWSDFSGPVLERIQ